MVLRFEPPLSEIAPPFFYVLWKKIEVASHVAGREGRGFIPAVMLSEARGFSP
jgi:hypothetical protein